MGEGAPVRRWPAALVLALAAYVALACLAPALHHDFACHLKSPSHCTACVASPLASRLGHAVPLDALRLPAAGAVEDALPAVADVVSSYRTPGRAPPA